MSIKQITPVTEEEKRVIKNKTAYGLPDRPSYTGMKASEIKAAFWTPLIDAPGHKSHSVISIIERVIEELNKILEDVADKNDTVESRREIMTSSSARLYGMQKGEDIIISPRANTDSREASADANINTTTIDKYVNHPDETLVQIYKSSIMARDSNGRCSILAPAFPKHIANKEYVDRELSKKVTSGKGPDIPGATPKIYVATYEGDDVIAPCSFTSNREGVNEAGENLTPEMIKLYGSTIMSRDSNGRSSIIGPVAPKHIANKEYVDKGDVIIKDGAGNLLKSVTFELTGTTLNIITSQEKE